MWWNKESLIYLFVDDMLLYMDHVLVSLLDDNLKWDIKVYLTWFR